MKKRKNFLPKLGPAIEEVPKDEESIHEENNPFYVNEKEKVKAVENNVNARIKQDREI